MERKIQPYSGPRGGHREEGKKMDTETKTQDAEESTKVPEGGIKRREGFEVDIAWYALTILSDKDKIGQFSAEQISDTICKDLITEQYPPENLKIMECEKEKFNHFSAKGILYE